MSQQIINIGSIANDGTGDTLRGAFSNTNNNFTELYNNSDNATSNITRVTVGANNWANTVSVAGNSYTIQVGAASNTWANAVGTAGNNYMITIVTGVNSNAVNNAVGANAWSNTLYVTALQNANNDANSANAYTVTVGAASNTWANTVGTAGNNYMISLITAINSNAVSDAAGANDWSNVAYSRANTAWEYANAVNTYVTLKGPFSNDSVASAGGVFVMGLYYTSDGNVRIRLV